MRPALRVALPLAALCAALVHAPARGAESYDGCTGFIDVLPAALTTQGTWCLRKDLATALTSGDAIAVQAHNVVVDCNGFKLGGLSGGPGSMARGITADGRNNVTVRGCNVRGFRVGVHLEGSGHVVEDNRFEGNLAAAIVLASQIGRIEGNLVLDTGPDAGFDGAIHVDGDADVVDNTVDTVEGTDGIFPVVGIRTHSLAGLVAGNRVRGVTNLHPEGTTRGIVLGTRAGSRAIARDNSLIAAPGEFGIGLYCHNATSISRDNDATGWDLGAYGGIENCVSEGSIVVP